MPFSKSVPPPIKPPGRSLGKNTELETSPSDSYPEDFLMNRQEEKTRGRPIGFRFTLSPGSDFIGSFVYQGVDYINRTATPDVFDINGHENSASGEIQYLFRSRALNVTAGIGHFQVDRNEKWSLIMLGPPLTPLPLLYDEKDIHHTNLYLYSYINYLKNVTLTLGVSADLFRGGLKDRRQLNPKLGLTWNPFPQQPSGGPPSEHSAGP